MQYEEFKENFIKEFPNYLPAKYKNWSVTVREIPKVNGYMEGIHLVPPDKGFASPTIYFEELYADYQQIKKIEQVLEKAAATFVLGIDYVTRLKADAFLDLPKEKVIFTLINGDENQRLLSQVPHRTILDLALIYRVLISAEDGGFHSTIISYEMAAQMDLTEEQLYDLALENTPDILPLQVEHIDQYFGILTNEKQLLGATVVMYPQVLAKVAEELDSNLYILPSSIHEVFVVPDVGQKVSEMNRMIADANGCVVRKEEILSRHVYYYNRENDQLSVPLGLVWPQ